MAPSKLLSHPTALCNIMRRLLLEAGEAALDYSDYVGLTEEEAQADAAPFALARTKIDARLRDGLYALLPDVPFLDGTAPSSGPCWAVAALEGEAGFLDEGGEFTLSLALLTDGIPVIGTIYAPVSGELYAGWGAGEALRWTEQAGDKPLRPYRDSSKGLVVALRDEGDDRRARDRFLDTQQVEKAVRRGGALPFCAIAAGKADIFPYFGLADRAGLAAGDALLRAVGGTIRDPSGSAIRYDRPLPQSGFVAASRAWSDIDWWEAA